MSSADCIVIDLTMEDDDASSTSSFPQDAFTRTIKQEPDLQDLIEANTLPDLPPSSMDEDIFEITSTDEFNEGFRDTLADMLSGYHNSSHAHDAPVVDSSYEDAVSAVERKHREIATKEAAGHSVVAEQVELKALEDTVFQAEKRKQRLRDYEDRQNEENSMFVKEEYSDVDEDNLITRVPTRIEATGYVEQSSEVEVSDDNGTPRQTATRGKTGRPKKPPLTRGKTRVTKKAQSARRGGCQSNANMLNFGSLLRNDVVHDARANQGIRQQPAIKTTKNRKDALNALIASIPKDQQDTAYGMRAKIDKACKTFSWKGNGSMKADGRSGWRLKGMDSSLKTFQLLSTAWGVERERGQSAPFGGILADTMGYGKTVQMITIMIENQPKVQAKNKTTLIILPSSIVTQWVEEIVKHTEDKVMNNVFVYKSGSRIAMPDPCQVLRKYEVVITTYHEVMRNYPKCEPPVHLVTDRGKDAWWEKYYDENRGPLLSTQMIKNHESRTSKACRMLTSKYKWVLTGTPLSNCMEELYPYFDFLGVEGSATYTQFKHNYAKRNDVSMQRLDAILRTVMTRRTGSDRLFGAPLTNLPALDHETIKVPFNPVERAIYNVVRQRFIARINDWSHSGKINQLSKNIFVMLLRLRQMCAHVLMITTTITDLLESEDIEVLWKAIERHAQGPRNNAGTKTAVILSRILRARRDEKQEAHETPAASSSNDQNQTVDLTINDADFDFRGFFFKLQRDDAWDVIRRRSTCSSCNEVSEGRTKLSVPCGHLYCEECITVLLGSAQQANAEAECVACQREITGSADMTAIKRIAAEADRHSRQKTSPQEVPKRQGTKTGKNNAELAWLAYPGVEKLSSKVQAITGTMQKWINDDPEAKIVVFSLFIPMIKVLAKVCTQKNWGYQEFTGQTTSDVRTRNLQRWKDPSEGYQVLLMSMRAGGLGLNLVEASYVIICDPWWNEPAEDQAFSRVYRIGQEKDCVVRRFVIADAVDTQLMLHLQKLKAQECDRVIDGRSNAELSIPDLLRLFGPTRRDPQTGETVVEGDDGTDEFIQGSEHVVIEDSDVEEIMPAPARPRDT